MKRMIRIRQARTGALTIEVRRHTKRKARILLGVALTTPETIRADVTALIEHVNTRFPEAGSVATSTVGGG